MSVVEWQTDAIEAQAGKESGILLHEKVFEELVEEEFLLLLPQNLQHGSPMLKLMTRVSGTGGNQQVPEAVQLWKQLHEVLHVHPSSQSSTTKYDCISLFIEHLLSFNSQESVRHSVTVFEGGGGVLEEVEFARELCRGGGEALDAEAYMLGHRSLEPSLPYA
jgi:hypothetical protein